MGRSGVVRRICYVSGTRADFGLMARTLGCLHESPDFQLGICVTGMHLSAKYGGTVREIEGAGLPIVARVRTEVEETSGRAMAVATGQALLGLASALADWRPHLLLLLGDRGEMLASAIAATYLGIPIAHVHGGERSGNVDEPVRHAISKLAHYHFVATPSSRERLAKMGEAPESIFVTGAPGLDELAEFAPAPREALCASAALDPARPVCLVVFHPVVQEQSSAGEQARSLLDGLLQAGVQVVALAPNADAGADDIRAVYRTYAAHNDVRFYDHLPRSEYLSWLARADAMVGNSSSGIIEAASFGQWVVNVGSRQRLRERSDNVLDVPPERTAIARAVAEAIGRERGCRRNVYGDGRASERIVQILRQLPLHQAVLEKINAY
jgi:GDP/UDP-N,N'-diacetylbacillosamine 2-epimerase (hydrolysing)